MKSIYTIICFSLLLTALFLSLGVFSGLITIKVPTPWLLSPTAFIYRHLRLSIVAFGALIILYSWLVYRMRSLIQDASTELAQLTFYDRLLNTTISTFFGVGVIWTAIGMEMALIHALEGVGIEGTTVEAGAYGLLERLVNGGLLLALSTTVFGGFCGYSLRLLKIVLLGHQWDRLILKNSQNTHGNT